MNSISLIVPGQPKSKPRPRVTRRGTYIPRCAKDYEEYVKWLFIQKYPKFQPLTGAVKLVITAYFKKPKKNKDVYPIKKPDIDNIQKIIMDALNKIAYKDDKQIVEVATKKMFADDPKVEIVIAEL